MLSVSTYRKFARFYDLYVGDFKADLPIYKSICLKNDAILEIGCGTGRILKSLLENGNQVTGVDISEEMLDSAKFKLSKYIKDKKIVLKNHNFLNKPLNRKFDKVLMTFFTFNYILHSPELFLNNVYQSMGSGATILADLFYPRGLNDSSIDKKWITKKFDHLILLDKRSIQDNLETRIQVFEDGKDMIEIETKRRYYNPMEIKELFEKSGFKNIQFSIGYINSRFSDSIDENKLETNFFIKAVK